MKTQREGRAPRAERRPDTGRRADRASSAAAPQGGPPLRDRRAAGEGWDPDDADSSAARASCAAAAERVAGDLRLAIMAYLEGDESALPDTVASAV